MRPAEIAPGDVLSYAEMCQAEHARLWRGMNFRLRGGLSVVLMSVQPDAPYADALQDEGRTLIYEGHNAPLSPDCPNPDEEDQPARLPSGRLTQNGLFYEAAERFKRGEEVAELVKVYEKMKPGLWVFNGTFRLTDAWQAEQNERKVWKFRLEIVEESTEPRKAAKSSEPSRLIPAHVKLEVWRRDAGKCAQCGADVNLHFDHILPYSKGGTSENAANIQLLCQSCNLTKGARIE